MSHLFETFGSDGCLQDILKVLNRGKMCVLETQTLFETF